MRKGLKLPVTFRTREGDEEETQGSGCAIGGMWVDKTLTIILKVNVWYYPSLPGAFTSLVPSKQLPGFEENYDKIRSLGIDEIYCMSVNDSFVMNAWAKQQNIQNVKVIPDGSANFTRFMGMLVGKNHLGFGMRSWRYMAVVNDGVIEKWWQEPGINNDGEDDDPIY